MAEEFGGIDSVRLGELPEPAAGVGQVLFRVHAVGIGPWDVGLLAAVPRGQVVLQIGQ